MFCKDANNNHSWLRNKGAAEIAGLSISLVIQGLVLIFVLIVAGYIYQNFKSIENKFLISELVGDTQRIFTARSGYGTEDITQALISRGSVLSFFIKDDGSGQTIESAYGTPVNVVGDTDTFYVFLDELDDSQCMELADVYMSSSSGNSPVKNGQINGSDVSLPVTVSTATSSCNGGDGGNSVAIGYQ